jgi:hypothetical protein
MKLIYNQLASSPGLRRLALAAAMLTGSTAAHAQFYTASNVVNQGGTFTDLGATGAAIATANFDDANSVATPIGFSFSYGGTAFTDFVLNTNGFLKLGTTAPGAPYFSAYAQEAYTSGPLNSAAETNLILPFNTDLEAGSGATEYRVATTGTAPNRVCTIQWKNVSDKTRAASSAAAGNIDKQFANFSFQVKLFETSNIVSFVYGTATASTNPTNASFIVVGVKGASTATAQVVTAVKASNTSWSGTTFQQGPYTNATNAHNVRNTPTVTGATPLPDAGRTYSFLPSSPNDAGVQIVYAYDQLAVPSGQPATLRAAIRNSGTAALTNVVATLNVSGANTATATQAIPSLAVGATAVVTFNNVALPNAGNNTVTVTVPNDDNNTNNSNSAAMVTNATTFSYYTPTAGSGNSVFTTGTADGYFAAKFTLSASANITAVRGLISEASTSATSKTSVGETVYGVVINATTGALLARSPGYVITAADINTMHTFTLSTPATVPAGDVLVGMAQAALAVPTTGVNFFPFGVQNEVPTRLNTFYLGSAASATAPTPALTAAAQAIYKFPFEAVIAPVATCPQPTNLVATATTATTASFSFTAAAGATGYQIVYGPQGFTPGPTSSTTPTFTGTTYTVTSLSPATSYDFYVRTICSATDQSGLTGPARATTACTPPVISTFPYSQNFDVVTAGQTVPCGITVADINNDGFTWKATGTVDPTLATGNISRSTPNAMVYSYNNVGPTPTVGADDWFFSPALTLNNTQRYRVSFYYRVAAGGYSERLEVKYGTATTPAGQTNLLYTNNNLTNSAYQLANNASAPVVADILATGTYFVGFHATSLANQGFLAIDDLTITAGPLATSEALKRAVSVFPNPSNTGSFNLEIHGANAKQAMSVEVTNMLGQRVYTGSAKDNFRNTVDLSTLASGIYTLKVRNGEEYTQQQISIVK